MKNIVDFKTGERPLSTRGGFPYDRLIKSLQALKDTTKCVILEKDEITPNQITALRGLVRKNNLGWVKKAYVDSRYHLWIVDEEPV